MPKKSRVPIGKKERHDPLGVVIDRDADRKFAKMKERRVDKHQGEEEDDTMEGQFSSAVSKKIMNMAKDQLQEETALRRQELENKKKRNDDDAQMAGESDDDKNGELDDEDDDDELEMEYVHRDDYAEMQVRKEDERALEAFMNKKGGERRNLGDIIMDKIKASESRVAASGTHLAYNEAEGLQKQALSPKLVEVYQSIGKLLKRYRSGKIPKAFKVIPALRNWEEILYYTNPDEWSAQAMGAATRLFASNLNKRMAQRFYALVLLPAVRNDIYENKKLNYHLYMALKKALYRPNAFFKGILLPLCQEGDCTLREAAIIGSVLAKVSIPMMPSAAAMLKMSSMEYSGATSLFLRVLLNKKYSLPYKVIDGLVRHFLAFKRETRELPVLWHQSLLVFAQRYKTSLTAEQKEALKPLLKLHYHHQITPEIRRELFNSANREPKF